MNRSRLGAVVVFLVILTAACGRVHFRALPAAPDPRAVTIAFLQDAHDGLERDHTLDWVQDGDYRYADQILTDAMTLAKTAIDAPSAVRTLLVEAMGIMPNDGPGDPAQALHDSRLRPYFNELMTHFPIVTH